VQEWQGSRQNVLVVSLTRGILGTEAPCLGSLSEMTGILKFVLEAGGEI